jgi:TrmH family RNA methyltransferase
MPSHLASRHNPRVKHLVRLRTRRHRETDQQIVIDGAREVARALAAGLVPIEVYWCESCGATPQLEQTLALVREQGANVVTVSTEVYQRIGFGDRGDGLLALAATPQTSLADLVLPPRPLVAIADGIEKPGNVGALLRSADGAGIDAVIVTGEGTDLYNPNAIRASVSTVFNPGVVAATWETTREWLSAHDLPVIITTPDAATIYHEVDYRDGAAIVLGSEAQGLSTRWRESRELGPRVREVRVPMRGIADSLNVSVTAAVLFYEAQRQRDATTGR